MSLENTLSHLDRHSGLPKTCNTLAFLSKKNIVVLSAWLYLHFSLLKNNQTKHNLNILPKKDMQHIFMGTLASPWGSNGFLKKAEANA